MENNPHRPVISVIVPVYKVEPYLRQCIDSILAQTYTNFELILVDDGSPDNCGAICDEYAARDSRIVVIHQENQGVSVARNAALDIMRGEYVAFIDSDDYIAPKYLETLLDAIETYQADIATCHWMDSVDGELNTSEHVLSTLHTKRVLTGADAVYRMYNQEIAIGVQVWAKLISSKLLMHKQFPINKACEDRAVIPYVIYDSKKVVVVSELLYYYRIRAGSLEHQPFSVKRFEDVQHMNDFIAFLKANNESKAVRAAEKRRHFILAVYTLQARVAGITDIPEDCRMNTLTALAAVRNEFSHDRFCWYIHQIYPGLLRPYLYFNKIESIFRKK